MPCPFGRSARGAGLVSARFPVALWPQPYSVGDQFFWISILLSLVAFFLLRGTPESKAARDPAEASGHFDWNGLVCFIIMLVAINVYISQGPNIGWLSLIGIALVVAFVAFGLAFIQIETGKGTAFVDLRLFRNGTFTGATLSHFLLNGAAGTLIVALGLVQVAAGMSSLQSGC